MSNIFNDDGHALTELIAFNLECYLFRDILEDPYVNSAKYFNRSLKGTFIVLLDQRTDSNAKKSASRTLRETWRSYRKSLYGKAPKIKNDWVDVPDCDFYPGGTSVGLSNILYFLYHFVKPHSPIDRTFDELVSVLRKAKTHDNSSVRMTSSESVLALEKLRYAADFIVHKWEENWGNYYANL